MPNLIGQSLGRYHIVEQLGQGGMASVFKGYDTLLERDVAIKVIRVDQFAPAVLDEVLKRFEREAKALARMSHPNIVHIHDYGEYQGAPFLVMEYLPGGTLKAQLGKPMPWQEAKRILLPIAQALAYAHEHNIIHRDIKPSNILLTDKGIPMLSDFGIAKILERDLAASLTGTGMGVGTPEYMAPEQWIGQAGPLSDLYSLGVVLYELVTGRKPYAADTPAAIMLKQANDPLPHPRRFAPDLPEEVEKVLFKALAKNPSDRYQSMGEFAAALERLSSGLTAGVAVPPPISVAAEGTRFQPEAIRPPAVETRQVKFPEQPAPTPPRWGRWALISGIAAAACLLLAGGSAVLYFLFVKGPTNLPHQATATLSATLPVLPTAVPTLVTTIAPTTPILPTQVPPTGETPQPTETPPSTQEPTLAAGATKINPKDGLAMVYIPAGAFTMGQTVEGALAVCNNYFNDCAGSWFSDEQPHNVNLSAFWIDQTEVTNAAYAKCAQAGACQPPSSYATSTRSSYYGNPQYDNYPVVYVDWFQASAYCAWSGGSLPSEAQWEKAARGTDGRIFPWGNNLPTCTLANFGETSNCGGDTKPVNSQPSGASPYVLLNMAGNVAEWVSDWYGSDYYSQNVSSNPSGPASGQNRVLRGGSWNLNPNYLRTTNRDNQPPVNRNDHIGFRCVGN